jgi:uncharacterized protein YkwD
MEEGGARGVAWQLRARDFGEIGLRTEGRRLSFSVTMKPRLLMVALALWPLAGGPATLRAEDVANAATATPPSPRIRLVFNTGPTERISEKFTAAQLTEALLAETNRVRVEHRLLPLKLLEPLTKAADDQAAFLALTGQASHESQLPRQRTPVDRAGRHGVDDARIGENVLAMTLVTADIPLTSQGIAAQLVEQWMNSPGHRANLLKRDFTHFGAAVRFAKGIGNAERTYAVQVFAAKPAR